MKKLLLFLFSAFAFAACEQAPIEEAHGVADSNRILSVSFEGDDTRIQLNEAQKTVWTKGDHVSVFYRSAVNEEWQFDGETGDRTGQIVPVDNSVNPPATHNRVVVIYPYNNEYYLNTETYSIEASLPAIQNYLKDSYGTNGNIMVSSNDYKQVSLKSVCGWLKLQLTGDGEVVKSITFKGNNGEQVAGELHINTSDATCVLASASGDAGESEVGGTLVRPGTILTEVTLDCGDGVTLGAEATAFYIALPPQTFENGFTVDIKSDGYKPMILSTSNALTIERNHIQPMASVEHNATPKIPNNQIWYTSSNGKVVTPDNTDVFGATIISNEYNNGMGVITFDGDVTTIVKYAFYWCTSLTSVTIPDSVTAIGDGAFRYCDSLTSVNIPNSVTSIGESAFGSCTSLTSVNIPDSVTTIGEWTFADCDSLTSVNIPDSVTTIGQYAFDSCSSLTSVTIGDSVTSIGMRAFAYCTSLKEFKGIYATDDGRSLIVDNTIIAYANASGNTYTIPDSVTTIGEGAFYKCTSLTSVNIPNSVTTIGEWAFSSCSSLTSVNIPDSVTTIGSYAFKHCSSLTSVNIPDSVTTIGEGAFHVCTSLTSVNIPDSVTTIGQDAFSDCTSLTSVNIPDSVTTIGYYAFHSCTSLTSVNIPDSVTEIGSSAFYNCTSLTSVNIPDSVTTIGNYAFSSCTILTSVTIGDSVTTIGEGAFYSCTSLTSVYCKATTPPALGSNAFKYWNGSYDVPYGCDIYVPAGSVEAYKSATRWSEYADAIIGYDFENGEIVEVQPNNEIWYTSSDGNVVTPDNTNAFGANILSNTYNDGMGVITFDGDVTSIGDSALYNCNSLTSVTIPDSLTSIGNYAFYGCESLTSVNIPDSVTSIGDYAFACCYSLQEFKGKFATDDGRSLIRGNRIVAYANASGTTYTIPDSVTIIGSGAFAGCYSLTSVNIHDSVTTIGGWAFSDCNSLTSVTIPDSVTTIGMYAFYDCTSLKEFTGKFAEDNGRILVVDGVLTAFAPAGITEYNIPDGVTKIGNGAFYECSSLTSVTIPDSVTTIGELAFDDCDSLTSVNIPDSVTSIGDCAFGSCKSLTSVNIPDSVTSIGNYAFSSCDSLTSVYCKATTPPALGGTYVFDYNGSGRKIYVPAGSVNAYKSATRWSEYASAIVGYDFDNGVVVE